MAPAVDAVIEQVLGADGKEALLLAGRYRRDVY
jgi:sulfite reductase (NADPH) flavoprotein alpha-component